MGTCYCLVLWSDMLRAKSEASCSEANGAENDVRTGRQLDVQGAPLRSCGDLPLPNSLLIYQLKDSFAVVACLASAGEHQAGGVRQVAGITSDRLRHRGVRSHGCRHR